MIADRPPVRRLHKGQPLADRALHADPDADGVRLLLPVASSVIANETIGNVRSCTCASCATEWNEVRIRCMACGSTKGLTYRSVETHEATVKAECCAECQGWLKILYQVKNASLDPVADDVGSLGLDLMMRDTGLKRGGFHPFLAGF